MIECCSSAYDECRDDSCVCLLTYLPTYLSICLPIYLPKYLSVYLTIYIHTYLSAHLPLYLLTYLPTYQPTNQPTNQPNPTYLPTYLSVCFTAEVSIYQELHGSNEWNGSVLAGMLVLGTAGALLPSLLRHDGSTSGTKFIATSELIVGATSTPSLHLSLEKAISIEATTG